MKVETIQTDGQQPTVFIYYHEADDDMGEIKHAITLDELLDDLEKAILNLSSSDDYNLQQQRRSIFVAIELIRKHAGMMY